MEKKKAFTLVIHPKIKEDIEAVAKAKGLGMSELVRRWIQDGVREFKKEVKEYDTPVSPKVGGS